MTPIPVIGVPIVTGVHWIERLIDSVDYPVDELYIVNNNGRGEIDDELYSLSKKKHKFIKRITISNLPGNIGCSGAWNLIIKSHVMAPYWVIVNHDVAFTPGLLKEMVDKSGGDCGIVKPYTFQWDLFLIKENVIQECGLFDENFSPAYMEDCDYYVRMLNKNIKIEQLSIEHLHGNRLGSEYGEEDGGSQTRKESSREVELQLYYSHDQNSWYMARKWGPTWRDIDWNFNPWKHPYNKEDIPITYTTYDLEFIRTKHLGF